MREKHQIDTKQKWTLMQWKSMEAQRIFSPMHLVMENVIEGIKIYKFAFFIPFNDSKLSIIGYIWSNKSSKTRHSCAKDSIPSYDK